MIDFGDTNRQVVYTFGEELTCMAKWGHAEYAAVPALDIEVNFTRIYT